MNYHVPLFVAAAFSGLGAFVALSRNVPDSVLQEPVPQRLPTPNLSPSSGNEQFIEGQFSPDGKFFAAKSSSPNGTSRTFHVWDTLAQSSPQLFGRWKLRHLEEFALAPHRRIVAVTTGERQQLGIGIPYAVELRDLRSGKVTRTLMRGTTIRSGIYSLAWSPDGHLLATGSGDGLARVWNAHTGQRLASLLVGGSVSAVQFSPNGTSLATRGKGTKGVQIWDFRHKVLLRTTPFASYAADLKFSPDGKTLAVTDASSDEMEPVKLLDMAGFGAPVSFSSPLHSGFPYHSPTVAFSHNSHWIAMANPPFIEVKSVDLQQFTARIKALQRRDTRLVALQFMPRKLILRWVTFQVGVDENNMPSSRDPKLWQIHIIPNITSS